MNEQKHIDHLRDVQRHCGGFQHALIEAWFKADGGNRRTIEKAFPHTHRIPIGRPPHKDTEDEACDMLYGVDNNQ